MVAVFDLQIERHVLILRNADMYYKAQTIPTPTRPLQGIQMIFFQFSPSV
jgi:hypothetical protein